MTGVRLSSVVMWGQDHSGVAPHDAAVAKVFATELLQRLARVGSELVGIEALEYAPLFASTDAPLRGRLAWEVLERIHPTISVGANEVQRDLMARSALGLRRARPPKSDGAGLVIIGGGPTPGGARRLGGLGRPRPGASGHG